eukprot:391822_1
MREMTNGLLSWHRNFFLFLCVVKGVQTDHYPGTHTNKNTSIIRPKIQNTKTQKHPTTQTISTSKIPILSPYKYTTISPIQPSISPTTTITQLRILLNAIKCKFETFEFLG